MVVKYAAGTNPKRPPRKIAPNPDKTTINTSPKLCNLFFLYKIAKDKTIQKIIPANRPIIYPSAGVAEITANTPANAPNKTVSNR